MVRQDREERGNRPVRRGGKFNRNNDRNEDRRRGGHRGRPNNNRRGGPRSEIRDKRKPVDKDSLNRQMTEYWINTKGDPKAKEELKQVATKKMNDELVDYFKKKAKEEAEPTQV